MGRNKDLGCPRLEKELYKRRYRRAVNQESLIAGAESFKKSYLPRVCPGLFKKKEALAYEFGI